MNAPSLYWLPHVEDFRSLVRQLGDFGEAEALRRAVDLANTRLDFTSTSALDIAFRRRFPDAPPAGMDGIPIRLAVLGSSTLSHLHASIRVAGLRRNLWIDTYECQYGQYFQELSFPDSALHRFGPTVVLFSFDHAHATRSIASVRTTEEAASAIDAFIDHVSQCWALARDAFGGRILQQTVMNVPAPVLGQNEHRLPESRARAIGIINARLRMAADSAGVDLVALDQRIGHDGLANWHDPVLWTRAKQEIRHFASPFYGDMVGRLLAAQQGRAAKCLVLDLDNTLWGGVIGDDGLAGIVVGQGSSAGEGYLAVQSYAKDLSRRGIILAVCSKNDEVNAWEPFDKHPEMVLKRSDIACLQANWNDKPHNIKIIAESLNIGLDSMVFLEDNPFERTLVREQLPMVAVPEFPDEPAMVPQMLADAGYFEAPSITENDRSRSEQYQGNLARQQFQDSATDLESYLRGLDMKLIWNRFDTVSLGRVSELTNRTNQFNLTTRRYSQDDIAAIAGDPNHIGIQLRLLDRFGDNGIIGVVIGKRVDQDIVEVDTWLMSCRVLGRQIEETTLNIVANEARAFGARYLLGLYIPTKKNGMVKDHFAKLGFEKLAEGSDGSVTWRLDLDKFDPAGSFIEVVQGEMA